MKLKSYANYSTKELSSLNYNEEFKRQIEEKFFEPKDLGDKVCDKAYNMSYSLLKLNLV